MALKWGLKSPFFYALTKVRKNAKMSMVLQMVLQMVLHFAKNSITFGGGKWG